MEWHWWHFDAIDYNVHNQQQQAVYLIQDKTCARHVDLEKGNFDYLMGCDLDMDRPEVLGELNYWGEWDLDTMAVLMGNGTAGTKWMDTGKPDTGYIALTQAVATVVSTNTDGWGEFYCQGGSVSVWVPESSDRSAK